jgi:hypothetical protein
MISFLGVKGLTELSQMMMRNDIVETEPLTTHPSHVHRGETATSADPLT